MGMAPSSALREAGSPTPARRRSGRRPSATHVLIAVVVILAFVLNLLVLQDRSATTLVALADRPLVAGSTLEASAVRLVPVDSTFEGLDSLVTEDELSQYEGWVMARSVVAGSPLAAGDVTDPGSAPGLRSMSLPVPVEHAAGGSLVVGDRVDVISVLDGAARFIGTGLEVVSISDGDSGSIGSVSAYHVTVAVDPDQALRLAEALDAGSLELVRSTGSDQVFEDSDDG